jgi:hypothetical protein
VESIMLWLLLLNLVTPLSKPLSRSSGSGTPAGLGSYGQSSPPPVCDPGTQSCGGRTN